MKILVYTAPSRGELFPIIPALLELRARGHRVAVRTLDECVDDLRTLGLHAKPLMKDVVAIALDDWKATTSKDAQARAMQVFGRRAPLDAADLRSAMDEEQPDMLLVDVMAYGAMAAAEASSLPWGAWLPSPAWLRGPGLAPYGPGLPPLDGPAGDARNAAIAPFVEEPARNFVAAANAGRAFVKLAPIDKPEDLLLRPPLLLYLTAEPFEYPRASWPSSFVLTGPCPWEPRAESPQWLSEERRPIVLVSTSSEFQDDGRLIGTTLAALRERDDLLVLATVPASDPATYKCPPNARIEKFIPRGQVLSRAIAVVCHAGMGITQKALAAGVPVCAVPFGRDQLEVACRVEVSGAGVRLPAENLNEERLRVAIERTVACRAGAERIARAFAEAGGAPAAASAVERLGGSARSA